MVGPVGGEEAGFGVIRVCPLGLPWDSMLFLFSSFLIHDISDFSLSLEDREPESGPG